MKSMLETLARALLYIENEKQNGEKYRIRTLQWVLLKEGYDPEIVQMIVDWHNEGALKDCIN